MAKKPILRKPAAPRKASVIPSLDVAIIGGGPGGLYTAWRLLHPEHEANSSKTRTPPTLAVFEYLAREGGRVKTIDMKVPGFAADIGAMRYKSTQVFVASLVDSFSQGGGFDTYEHTFPTTHYYLRARHVLPTLKVDAQGNPLVDHVQESLMMFTPGRMDDSGKVVVEPSVKPQTAYLLEGDETFYDPEGLLSYAFRLALGRRVTLDPEMNSDRAVHASKPGTNRDALQTKLKALVDRDPTDGRRFRIRDLSHKQFTPIEWYCIKRYGLLDDEFKLADIGLWDLVQSVLSPEAFALARDGFGYHSILGNWNAAEHMEWFLADFAGAKFLSIKGGMKALPERLRREVEAKGATSQRKTGVPVFNMGHELVALRRDGKSYLLDFVVRHPGSKGMAKRDFTVRAEKVVLALPKGALEKIDYTGLGKHQLGWTHDEDLRRYFGKVTGNGLIKTFVFYDDSWWWTKLDDPHHESLKRHKRVAIDSAGTVIGSKLLTDVAIHQVYFHGPGSSAWTELRDTSKGRSVLMLYCDSREAEYWSLLAERGEWVPYCDMTQDLGQRIMEEHGADILDEYGVSQRILRSIHRYLANYVFKDIMTEIPFPASAICMDWSAPPFYAGWHAWNAGTRPWSDRLEVARPLTGQNLFIVGEAFSNEQGWIEGALRTSEFVLQSWFDVGRPSWKGFEIRLKGNGATFEGYVGLDEARLKEPV